MGAVEGDDAFAAVGGADGQGRAVVLRRVDRAGTDREEGAVLARRHPVLVGVGGHALDADPAGAGVDHREALALEGEQQGAVGGAYGGVVRLEPGTEAAFGAVRGDLDAAGRPVAGVDDGDVEGVVVRGVDVPAVTGDVDVEGAAADRHGPGHLPPPGVDDLQRAGTAGDVHADVDLPAVRGERDAHAAAAVLAGRHRARVRRVRDQGGALAGAGVHGGDALRGGHPRRAVVAERDPVRRGADPHRAQVGGRAPAGGVDEGDRVRLEVGDQQGAFGRARRRGSRGCGCRWCRRGWCVLPAAGRARGEHRRGGQCGERSRGGVPDHRCRPFPRRPVTRSSA